MTRSIATCLGIVTLAALAVTPLGAASHPPLTTRAGVVSSDNPDASDVGAKILGKGGNAVDAAIGTALALGVVNPSSSGIGGGGFAVVYIAAEDKVYAIDFRETAPAQLTPDKFVVDGKIDPKLSRSGGLAVGIPGEVAGLEHLSKKFGKLEWKDVVRPSEKLAKDGFDAHWFFAYASRIVATSLPKHHPFGRWLSPRGRVIAEGQLIRRSALGRTLQRIRKNGAKGFYSGAVAKDIVSAVKAGGGVMTVADLTGYKVVEREPIRGKWGDYELATMPLPSSGGIVVLEMLGILDATGVDLAALGAGSSMAIHYLAEVLKHGFADRARFLGDSEAANVAAEKLLDPKRLRKLAKRISKVRVRRSQDYGDKKLPKPKASKSDKGTTHLCAVDKAGNAVALTTTVNGYFGAKLIAPKSGVVLNNEIDDFALDTETPNMFGLVQSELNLVGPGKRPLSSMTPTLVFKDNKVVACLGGSGGPRIIANTFQVLLNLFVFKMNAREAVEAPRIHHQWMPHELQYEKEISNDVVRALKKKGHKLKVVKYRTAVQAIVVREDGVREAASDPRKAGAPAAQ